MHTSSDPMVRAGFSIHPSHPGAMEDFGEDEEAIYLEVNDNGAAQYFGPTPDIGDNLRPGGLAQNSIDLVGQSKAYTSTT